MLFLSCAGQAPPSGGPPDSTPPQIIDSYPLPNSLQFNGKKIVLKFSEYVDRTSVEQSVFFSPPVGTVFFDWGGTDVEISFSDSLRPNTTYILTIGTDVIDRRNRNRMASTFALPFSTGEVIDSAAIFGQVFAKPPDGVMIYAYKLDGLDPDTLNPTHTKPDYLTQTGSDGTFRLTNLALGSYRLLAVRDQFKNLLYESQTDEYGVPSTYTRVSRDSMFVTDVFFQLTKEDTTAPFLSSARSLERSHVLLRFSEPITLPPLDGKSLFIVDTLNNSALNIIDVSPVESALADIQLTTVPQESLATYRVVVANVRDLHDNIIHSDLNKAVFTAATNPDTLKPSMELIGFQDSTRNVQTDDTIRFSFSKAVQKQMFERGFELLDADKNKMKGDFVWVGSVSASFIPARQLELGKWYTINIHLDSLKDYSGQFAGDSIWTRRFQMVEEKYLGSIAGVVRDESWSFGPIHITVSEISNNNIKTRQTVADSSRGFMFHHLPEGRYVLSAFCDADSNGAYTFGKPFPYQLAERFSSKNDTLKVRARWPLEGVAIKIK